MDSRIKYLFIALGVLIIGFILWYFKSIITYILISAILSIIGKPVVDFLDRIHIKRIRIPKVLSAFITLILIWCALILFLRFFIPLIANQVSDLSSIDINTLTTKFQEPLDKMNQFIVKYNVSTENSKTVEDYISEKAIGFINGTFLSNFFGSLVGIFGNLVVAAFSISFITFFFLKDQSLFYNGIMVFVPEKLTDNFAHVLNSIKKLLTRYFIGILVEIIGIITLVTIGLTVIGINFQTAIVIGLILGLFNVVPYVGPLIGSTIGIIIGFATHLNMDVNSELIPLLIYMAIVFSMVRIIDDVVFQPFIYSSSVNAHPLEIFIVILMAASLAGILGMILAVPSYTILRVFAKEFFNNFKLVKKLTEKI
ncbi:MAG: hypothetical protein A2041_03805 [Bacteroidetes bacterium GWA2_31_9b]|nr:MAG: hypothetical protein A2041_03805 [Bacteroidetes bacterium GWA2_31_9b]